MKGRPTSSRWTRPLRFYARICGWTLARRTPGRRPGRHRRVPGRRDAFDRSIADFAERYADQNERDYKVFARPFGPAGSRRSKRT
jgi:hypothetical protein